MEILLKQRELLDLGEGLQGTKIICHEGQCWITQAGDSREHIVKSCDSFIIRARGRVIVAATDSCRIMLAASHKTSKLQTFHKEAYSAFINVSVSKHLFNARTQRTIF